MWVAVLQPDDDYPSGAKCRYFGPFDSKDKAESYGLRGNETIGAILLEAPIREVGYNGGT